MITINSPYLKKGFTLIEIMVALFIGIFLAAGAAKIFINTNASNHLQENLSRMQENARFAMMFLRNDIQQGGFLGGDCLENAGAVSSQLNLLPAPPFDPLLHSFTMPAVLKGAVSGANGVLSGVSTGLDSPDEITLRAFFSTNPQSVSTAMASTIANVQAKATNGFVKDDIILITDCKFADIFQVTNDPASSGDQLAHAAGGAGPLPADRIPGNSSGNLSRAYPKDARLYRLSNGGTGSLTRTYKIAPSTAAAIPSLFRNSDALVGDIENMQILYGVNTSNVSDAVNYNTPNYYTDITGLSADDLEQIKAVRISLLIQSHDNNLVSSKQSYFFNGATVSGANVPDFRIRRVYSSTITLRNRENYKP